MAENLSLPDLLTRILVDNADVKAKMVETNQLVAQSMGQMQKNVQTFTRRSTRSMNRMTENWWQKFARIAIGFTIAYRAINAFEAAVRRMSQTIRDAVLLSGELASLQAKLAFYYQTYSQDVIPFTMAFEKAAANVRELSRESLRSLSSLEELAIGYDEVAQSVGGLGKSSIKNLTALVDFTVLVAQTTGSTTRQIRQEIQSLLQGQVRTTDIAIRTMKRMGILTEENIRDLKRMINTGEILNNVLGEIYQRTEEMRRAVIRANIEIAIKKWDDSIKLLIVDAIAMASTMEGVSNIFAEVFFQQMQGIRQAMGLDDWRNMIRLMQVLRDVIDFLVRSFFVVIKSLGQIAVGVAALTKNLKDLLPALKIAGIVLLIYNSFRLLYSILKLIAGKLIIDVVKGLNTLRKALLGVGAASLVLSVRMSLLTTIIAAIAIAFASLVEGMKMADRLLKSFAENLRLIIEARAFEGEPPIIKKIKEIVAALRLASKEVIGDKGPLDLIKETFLKGAGNVGNALKALLRPVLDVVTGLFKDVVDISDQEIQKLLDNLDKVLKGEGLGMPGGREIFDPEAVKKLHSELAKLNSEFQVHIKTLAALSKGRLDWRDALGIDVFKEMIEIEEEYKTLVTEVGVVNANMWRDVAENTLKAETALKRYMDQMELSEDLTERLSELTTSFREHEIFMLNKEVDAMRIIANNNKQRLQEIDTYRKARLAEIENEFTGLADLARDVAGEMESAFSDLFFDVMAGEFDDLGDLAERTFRGMQRALADFLAMQARIALIGEEGAGGGFFGGLLSRFFGGGTPAPAPGGGAPAGYDPTFMYHQGGRVGYWGGFQKALASFIPRLHDGLKSDEIFAILQRGERVYKRGDMPFDKVEIHNYTPFETKTEERENAGGGRSIAVIVGEMMGDDVLQGGPLHRAMRKRFGLSPSVRGR